MFPRLRNPVIPGVISWRRPLGVGTATIDKNILPCYNTYIKMSEYIQNIRLLILVSYTAKLDNTVVHMLRINQSDYQHHYLPCTMLVWLFLSSCCSLAAYEYYKLLFQYYSVHTFCSALVCTPWLTFSNLVYNFQELKALDNTRYLK